MAHAMTAEDLFLELKQLPAIELQKFFSILAARAFCSDDLSHEQLFGHLADDTFTATEAAEYLEMSLSTFRRHVAGGKLTPSTTVGRNQLFAAPDLKRFKKALRLAKG